MLTAPGVRHPFLRGYPRNIHREPYTLPAAWNLNLALLEWATPAQVNAALFAASVPGCLLTHPTGAGKTFTTIAAAAAMRATRTVIITPKPVLRGYCKALTKFAPAIQWTRLRGLTPTAAEEWVWQGATNNAAPRVALVSWDTMAAWADTLAAFAGVNTAGTGGLLILDEAHRAKSPSRWDVLEHANGTRTFQYNDSWAGSTAFLAHSISRRLLATATPYARQRDDLWALCDYAEPSCWGTYRQYTEAYCGAGAGTYGWETAEDTNTPEFLARLATIQHHVPKSTLPLPRITIIPVRLTPQELDLNAAQGSLQIDAKRQRGAKGKFERLIAYAAAAKRRWTIDHVATWCREGRRCVIFVSRRTEVQNFADALASILPLGIPIYALHGGASETEIDTALDAYIEGKPDGDPAVLISTLDLLGEGVDGLHRVTTRAVLAALPYTPRQLVQALGRFQRLGGIEAEVYLPIGTGLIDEDILCTLSPRLRGYSTILAGNNELEQLAEDMSNRDEALRRIQERLVEKYTNLVA